MIDLGEIKSRVAASRPGPWEWGYTPWGSPHLRHRAGFEVINADPSGSEYALALDPGGADAAFIAHARTDVPALVAEVEKHRAVIRRLATEMPDSAVVAIAHIVLEEMGEPVAVEA